MTAFVGRQPELTQIAARLADPAVHLLTIVGPGGIGKSSLAIEAGRAAAGHFPDGVWFVSLAGLESAEQVPSAILNGLEVPGEGGSARQQLLRYLRGKHCLLILDNFEDVLPASELVVELLHTCPQVNLLVTTRERLNLREEWLLSLGSLAYPALVEDGAAADAPNRYSALQLFELSAQRLQPGFVLDGASLPPVIRICQLVDGMPLALEMAAAWVRALPLAAIPDEIEKSLAFLGNGIRDAAERHRSIHAVFDHSWQILTERERSVLRQLSIFRNSFSREAAQAVADASLLDLSTLLDKSWIRLTSDGRYQMHALAHQYTLEKLRSGMGESVGDVLQRHCLFYAALVLDEGRYSEGGAFVPAAEIENVKLAWQTALEQGNWSALGQISVAVIVMTDICDNLGILPNLEHTVAQLETELLAVPVANKEKRDAIEKALVRCLHIAGSRQTQGGNIKQGIAYLSRGRALLESHRQTTYTADNAYTHITSTLGFAYYNSGQFVKAEEHYQEALKGFARLGDSRNGAKTRTYLILLYVRQGRYANAEEWLRTDSDKLNEVGDWNQVLNRCWGWLLTRQGRYTEARRVLENSLQVTPPRYHSHALLYLGPAVRGQGKRTEALEILRRGVALAEEVGDQPAQADLLAELGFTALQLEVAETAQNYFNRSFAVAKEIGRRHTASRALLGLGRAALQQGQTVNARDYLVQALTVAAEVNAPPDLLDVLVGIAAFYAAEGKSEGAFELLDLAQRHPATTHETRTLSLRLSRALSVEQSLDTVLSWEAAQTRLDEVMHSTLKKL